MYIYTTLTTSTVSSSSLSTIDCGRQASVPSLSASPFIHTLPVRPFILRSIDAHCCLALTPSIALGFMAPRLHICCAACLALLLLHCIAPVSAAVNSFSKQFVVSWAPKNVKFLGAHGEALQLSLDQATGSGFASKESYLFGNIDMQIKLVPGDSAGTVTAYYLSSEGAQHDELDFEFLGNSSGQPYVVQTNVFSSGVGGREQRITLWFDPTKDFHTYSVAWSSTRILFLVDGIPIRVFSNNEKSAGVPYLSRQPMRVFSSIWNGDSWATRGGLVKINWAHAPFVASYRNFQPNNACIASTATVAAACAGSAAAASNHVSTAGSAAPGFDRSKLEWVKKNFMVYDYCTDAARYTPAPPECTREL